MWTLKPCSFSMREKEMNAQLFPEDVLVEILVWLPVRSLVRFRCVSKSWCALIKSPSFVKSHLERQRSGRVLLMRRCFRPPRNNDVLSFHDPVSPNLEKLQPNLPIPYLKDITCNFFGTIRPYVPVRVSVLGPCNGLVCIAHFELFILCNPSLREFKKLPACPDDCPRSDYCEPFVGHGFGNTSTNGEFKVVLIRPVYDNLPRTPCGLFYVYSSSTKLWRKIDYNPVLIAKKFYYIFSHIFFNGACHWHANGQSSLHFILSIDLNTEVIRRFEYPDLPEGMHAILMGLLVINGCLAMIRHPNGLRKGRVEVWVMKEYGVKESWSKQLVIPQPLIAPLLSWKENDEWLLSEINGKLASYASNPSRMKSFKFYGVRCTMRALIFEESLINVNQLG